VTFLLLLPNIQDLKETHQTIDVNVSVLVGPGHVVPVSTARKFGPQQGVSRPAGGDADLLAGGQLFRGVAARDAIVSDGTFGTTIRNCRLNT